MTRHTMLGLSFLIALTTGCASSGGSGGGGVGAPDWTEEKCWQEDQVTDILYYGVGVVRGLSNKALARTAAKKNAVKAALECANSPTPVRRGESQEDEAVAAAEGEAEAEEGEQAPTEGAEGEEAAPAEENAAAAEPAAEGGEGEAAAPKAVATKGITEDDLGKPTIEEEWEGSKGEVYVLVMVRMERPIE